LLNNPEASVDLYPLDLFSPNSPVSVEQALEGTNLVIGATDKVDVQLAINAAAWISGIPAVFGGCYESARGGEVLFTLPGEGTPCLACLRSGLNPPERDGPFDYSAAASAQDYQGEPGLSAAVDLITAVEAQVALAVLLRETSSALAGLVHPRLNYLLIGGALGAGYYRFSRPFQIFYQPLSGPRPDCPVCQEELPFRGELPEVSAALPEELRSLAQGG
jgi:molybdopterin/thiamine biosynthesis adenylyltransferase